MGIKSSKERVVVIDTNILLLEANNLFAFNDALVVLPETVLDEIDSKKTGFTDLAFQARAVGRILAKAETLQVINNHKRTVISVKAQGKNINLVSLPGYGSVSAHTSPAIANDNKIIDVAESLSDDYDVVFVSNDIMARTRALARGLAVTEFIEVDQTPAVFMKTVTVEDVDDIGGSPVDTIDAEYAPENYAYMLDEDGHTKIALIQNERVVILPDAVDKRIKAHPKNAEQRVLMAMVSDPYYNVVVSDSLAGSGKGYVTIAAAMRLVEKKTFSGIVYLRNSVDSVDKAEEIGYLPGAEEKFAPYYTPLMDTLGAFAYNKLKAKKLVAASLQEQIDAEVDSMLEKYNITPMTTLGLRGRTLDNTIVILDEAQNLSASSMQLVLTRLGDNAKLIVLGSQRQIDNSYLNKFSNGFAILLDASRRQVEDINIGAVKLHKVVRGKITKFAEHLFSS